MTTDKLDQQRRFDRYGIMEHYAGRDLRWVNAGFDALRNMSPIAQFFLEYTVDWFFADLGVRGRVCEAAHHLRQEFGHLLASHERRYILIALGRYWQLRGISRRIQGHSGQIPATDKITMEVIDDPC